MIVRLFPLMVATVLLAQDIVFPCEERGPVNNRTTSKPEDCPPNMLYIPEEEVCECETGFLYHGATDGCYVPYQQGPCPSGEHLVLPKDSEIAKCLKNPCGSNGTVPFADTCVHLLSPGPPCTQGRAVVLDEETYQLACVTVEVVLHQIITAPVRRCSRGSRRIASGKCRGIL